MKVTEVRKQLGISQAELARRVGCHPTSINRIEHGNEPAFAIRGKKIADALGWTGDWHELFAQDGTEHKPNKCLCGATIRNGWNFCPYCGLEVKMGVVK